jgi:hypothetical protein
MRILMRITDHDQGFCIQIQEQGKVIVDEIFVHKYYAHVKMQFLTMLNRIKNGGQFALVEMVHRADFTLATFEPTTEIKSKPAA